MISKHEISYPGNHANHAPTGPWEPISADLFKWNGEDNPTKLATSISSIILFVIYYTSIMYIY